MILFQNIFIVFFGFIFFVSCNFSQKKTFSAKDCIHEKLIVDEIEREYYLYIPQNKVKEKIPLLVMLHGRFGTAKLMLEGYNMNNMAEKEGFAVLYPNGYNRSWADGRGGTPADKNKINDVKFIETVLNNVKINFPIDDKKIFIAGHSNGGFMTQRMLLEKTNLFRAGASVTASISKNILEKFAPTKPVSVAFLSGTEDPLVSYEGGFVVDGEEILGAEDSVSRWVAWNECKKIPKIDKIDTKSDATSLEIYSYEECKENVSVRLYKIIGAGHMWPGIPQKIPFVNLGKPTEELDASEEIWRFFKSKF